MADERNWRMILPSDDAPANLRYSMPDPDGLADLAREARDVVFDIASVLQPSITLTREQATALLTLAEGYLVLTGGSGQERMVRKLRDIWRARRRRDGE